MSIEAMKQALEALEKAQPYLNEALQSVGGMAEYRVDFECGCAITALRTAIEAAEEQEAWKTSDTAYRPEGLPQDFTKHEVENEGDWSEWVCPDPTQYFMKCCDCGLVHEMQFNVVKYSEGDKCEDFDDPYVQAVFRARRHQVAEKQEDSLAQTNWDNIPQAFNDWWNADYDDSTNPFRLNSPAYWAWSGWSAANKEKQEPVAWGCNRYIEDDNGFQIGTDDPELAWGKYAPDDNGWWPLYTTPPAAQRQWVGLTDEDFENAFQETYIMGDSDLQDFAKVIEAKLKEKNT